MREVREGGRDGKTLGFFDCFPRKLNSSFNGRILICSDFFITQLRDTVMKNRQGRIIGNFPIYTIWSLL